jgi:hypothetical protein
MSLQINSGQVSPVDPLLVETDAVLVAVLASVALPGALVTDPDALLVVVLVDVVEVSVSSPELLAQPITRAQPNKFNTIRRERFMDIPLVVVSAPGGLEGQAGPRERTARGSPRTGRVHP